MHKRSKNIENKVYKFFHKKDEWIKTNIIGKPFENEWLLIEKDGKITLKGSFKDGYAWDGCSPKCHFMDMVLGTPDGKIDYQTEKPITYFASMFHDVIYQYKSKKGMDITRKEADILFMLILKDKKFIWWRVYTFFVRVFGGVCEKWNSKKSQRRIIIKECSWIENKNKNKA